MSLLGVAEVLSLKDFDFVRRFVAVIYDASPVKSKAAKGAYMDKSTPRLRPVKSGAATFAQASI